MEISDDEPTPTSIPKAIIIVDKGKVIAIPERAVEPVPFICPIYIVSTIL